MVTPGLSIKSSVYQFYPSSLLLIRWKVYHILKNQILTPFLNELHKLSSNNVHGLRVSHRIGITFLQNFIVLIEQRCCNFYMIANFSTMSSKIMSQMDHIGINTFQTNLKKCLEFCLSSSVLGPAYTSLCRRVKYLLKIKYI